jgi:hypothetical protein
MHGQLQDLTEYCCMDGVSLSVGWGLGGATHKGPVCVAAGMSYVMLVLCLGVHTAWKQYVCCVGTLLSWCFAVLVTRHRRCRLSSDWSGVHAEACRTGHVFVCVIYRPRVLWHNYCIGIVCAVACWATHVTCVCHVTVPDCSHRWPLLLQAMLPQHSTAQHTHLTALPAACVLHTPTNRPAGSAMPPHMPGSVTESTAVVCCCSLVLCVRPCVVFKVAFTALSTTCMFYLLSQSHVWFPVSGW